MPITEIPLAVNPSRRAFANVTSTKDQRLVACFVEEAPSPASKTKAVFVSKRNGLAALATPAAGSVGNNVYYSPGLDRIFVGYGSTNGAIYRSTTAGSTTSLGTMTGVVRKFDETVVSGVTHINWLSSDGTGWYFASDAADATAYTADGNNSTTITDIKISGVNSTAGLYPGQKLTAASNITAGTRVVSVDSAAFTAVLDTATTGGAFNDLAITKEPISKIIDTDFPPDAIGQFATLNGYNYVMDDDGNIYASDLNSMSSWNPANVALANAHSDPGRGVIRYKNLIAAFGSTSVEFFQHSSNATFGSPLMRIPESIGNIGAKKTAGVERTLYGSGHGTIFFIGEDFNLYMLDGLSAKKLTEAPFTSSVIMSDVMPFSSARKRFVCLVNSSLAGGEWYDIDTGMFTYSGFTNDTFITQPGTDGTVYAVDEGTGGKIYRMLPDQQATFQDDSSAYTMTIQLGRQFLNKGLGFTIRSVTLLADDQASGSTTLEVSKNDYADFSTVGTFDMPSTLKRIWGGGYCNNHVIFRLTHSANTAWRGQSLLVDWVPCTT